MSGRVARRKPGVRLQTPSHPHFTFPLLGLPEATPEYRFHPDRKWRVDWAWCPEKIALEIEGGAWQYGRHNRATGFLKDMEKYRELAIAGWLVIRVTPQELASGLAAELIKRAFENA
jgi:hypothetical protein